MLNSLRYEKIFSEIGESTGSQHDPSKDVIFLARHMFPLVSLSLAYR